MATKLYLKSSSPSFAAGLIAAGEQSAILPISGHVLDGGSSLAELAMNTTIGTAATSKSVSQSSSTGVHDVVLGRWISEPMTATATIGSGTWTFGLCIRPSSVTSETVMGILAMNVYVWRPATGQVVGRFFDSSSLFTYGTAITSASTATAARVWSQAGTGVAVKPGDVIVFEPVATSTKGATTVHTWSIYYNDTAEPTDNGPTSSTATYIQIPDTISLTYAYTTPTVTSLSVATGAPGGGTSVTLTGTDFKGATGVNFGTVAATSVVIVDNQTITCVSPAGNFSSVNVAVTTPLGTSPNAAGNLFVYQFLAQTTLNRFRPFRHLIGR